MSDQTERELRDACATALALCEMSGVFPLDFLMRDKPAAHGYTVVEVMGENPFYERGVVFRGHEFHYSDVAGTDADPEEYVFRMQRGRGIESGLDGLVRGN